MELQRRTGVVLAGGLGTRLGRTKGDLPFEGKTLAERAARLLQPLCDSVLISLRIGARNPAPDFRSVVDPAGEGQGPLAGIQAAFREAPQQDLLVLACDYPRVTEELLRCLIGAAGSADDLAFPVDGRGRDHPLVGLWRRRLASAVDDALASARRRVGNLVQAHRVLRLTPADPGCPNDLDRLLVNVNRIEDWNGLG